MGKVQLNIGDKVELSGGYDFDPIYLKKPAADKRTGTVIHFIEGQNKTTAAVIKLDTKINGEKIIGDIAILELRHKDATWFGKTFIVQVELCDFIPDNKSWENRKQGEWVESAATLKIIWVDKI